MRAAISWLTAFGKKWGGVLLNLFFPLPEGWTQDDLEQWRSQRRRDLEKVGRFDGLMERPPRAMEPELRVAKRETDQKSR